MEPIEAPPHAIWRDYFEAFGPDRWAEEDPAWAAHKLARILWAMVKHRRPYNPERLGNPELARARKERYLRRQAA